MLNNIDFCYYFDFYWLNYFYTSRVHERSKLCEILSPYLEELEGPSTKRRKLAEEEEDVDEDPFALYKSKGFAQTRLLLKAEGIHKKPRRYWAFFNLALDLIPSFNSQDTFYSFLMWIGWVLDPFSLWIVIKFNLFSRFYHLDSEKSLVWNLRDKVLVEHPIIYVIFADHYPYFQNGNFNIF